MRTFAGLFVGGVAALVLFKVFAALVLPLIGLFFALIAITVKVALFIAVASFIYALVRNRRREQTV